MGILQSVMDSVQGRADSPEPTSERDKIELCRSWLAHEAVSNSADLSAGVMVIGAIGSLLAPLFSGVSLELFPLVSFMGGTLGAGLIGQLASERADKISAKYRDLTGDRLDLILKAHRRNRSAQDQEPPQITAAS